MTSIRTDRAVLMTHLVAGYPTFEASLSIAGTLVKNGADILEVQIPFTDPLADGPCIMEACSCALENGTTPADCFKLVRAVSSESAIPVVLMSYCNPVLIAGMESFADRARESGACGLIVPDLPLDSSEGITLAHCCRDRDIWLIPVVSPGTRRERMEKILPLGSGFIYATLKVGITGSSSPLHLEDAFLETIRRITPLPVLAGFGITTVEQGTRIALKADGAVIGSHLLRLFKENGEKGIGGFISTLARAVEKERTNG